MTLFEVDEAASRVREEVEPEANIIFGATFDEKLEGIIRVSVVATGIEQETAHDHVAPPTAGMAELTRRLKSVGAPGTAPAAANPQQQPQPQQQQPRDRLPAYALEGLEQELAVSMQQVPPARAIAAPAPQARQPQARPAGDPSVRIGPFRPDPSLISSRGEAEAEQARAHETHRGAPAQFIPPAAERPEEMQPRMPRVEDFPAVAQRQMRAQQAPAASHDEERRPRGLLARLTSGLTGRNEDEEAEAPRAQQGRKADVEPRVIASQNAAQSAPSQSGASHGSDFAKPAQPRRMGEVGGAAGNLDPRGRQVPQEASRDDHLEIPAFLRRQTS
jgi:cell division protein FtsZ